MPKEQNYVKKQQKNPITYQNKDVVSKIFGENLKERSLAVYGINIPKIKEVLPTNLPTIDVLIWQKKSHLPGSRSFSCRDCWYLQIK